MSDDILKLKVDPSGVQFLLQVSVLNSAVVAAILVFSGHG